MTAAPKDDQDFQASPPVHLGLSPSLARRVGRGNRRPLEAPKRSDASRGVRLSAVEKAAER